MTFYSNKSLDQALNDHIETVVKSLNLLPEPSEPDPFYVVTITGPQVVELSPAGGNFAKATLGKADFKAALEPSGTKPVNTDASTATVAGVTLSAVKIENVTREIGSLKFGGYNSSSGEVTFKIEPTGTTSGNVLVGEADAEIRVGITQETSSELIYYHHTVRISFVFSEPAILAPTTPAPTIPAPAILDTPVPVLTDETFLGKPVYRHYVELTQASATSTFLHNVDHLVRYYGEYIQNGNKIAIPHKDFELVVSGGEETEGNLSAGVPDGEANYRVIVHYTDLYTYLDYIKLSDGAYFDTEVGPDGSDIKCEFDLKLNLPDDFLQNMNLYSGKGLFGGRSSAGSQEFSVVTSGTLGYFFGFSSAPRKGSATQISQDRLTLRVENKALWLVGDSQPLVAASATDNPRGGHNIYIGGVNTTKDNKGLDPSGLPMNIYSFKFSLGGEAKLDLVPVRNSDGTAGLLDRVNNKFLAPKAGTVVGSDES
jgi:hypothetical protein